jgi:hypothetical protein
MKSEMAVDWARVRDEATQKARHLASFSFDPFYSYIFTVKQVVGFFVGYTTLVQIPFSSPIILIDIFHLEVKDKQVVILPVTH